jgi:HSP20 family molecular chaperone IbpA
MSTLFNNTLFTELFGSSIHDCKLASQTSLVKDIGDVYTTDIELAGYDKSEIKITATDETLKIKAKNEDRSKNLTINLNNCVSINHIKSEYKNGLLKLTLPKKSVTDSLDIEIP